MGPWKVLSVSDSYEGIGTILAVLAIVAGIALVLDR
jgi:hypothetical protein